MSNLDTLDQLMAELHKARDLRQQHAERVIELKKQIVDLASQADAKTAARALGGGALCW
jgi:hypothetical protein